MPADLPETQDVVTAIERSVPAARAATEQSGFLGIIDRTCLEELGRLLAHCLVRDIAAARKAGGGA